MAKKTTSSKRGPGKETAADHGTSSDKTGAEPSKSEEDSPDAAEEKKTGQETPADTGPAQEPEEAGDETGLSGTEGSGAAEPEPEEKPAEQEEQDATGFDHAETSAPTSSTGQPTTKPPLDQEPLEPGAAAATRPSTGLKGIFALLLGGIIAGLIGYGASQYLGSATGTGKAAAIEALRAETEAKLQDQAGRLSALAEQLDSTAKAADVTRIEKTQTKLLNDVANLAEGLRKAEQDIAGLAKRIGALESRPLDESVSEAAKAAYEAELKKLQDAMAAQRAEIEAMIAEARQLKTNAEETSRAALQRAALVRIQTALDTGGGFADALADLEATGVTVPDVLSKASAKGVATLAELQERFPDAARAALTAAREAAVKAGEPGGWTDLLRTALGARSLEPREGNDPDAILSRAEAAVRDGRLTDALAEVETLPEVARAELSDWTAEAKRRLEVVAAAQALSEELN